MYLHYVQCAHALPLIVNTHYELGRASLAVDTAGLLEASLRRLENRPLG